MAVILKGGAVFPHIPKTGGTWVTLVLKDCGLACFHDYGTIFKGVTWPLDRLWALAWSPELQLELSLRKRLGRRSAGR